ncbi:MAG: hybrid sensor histidine kinase/response regulator, partial [Lachnospiraceae bacterium]|nr:hybrid sensor histidine kinase/response regulator [Lachnospiraceae bacterium]
MKGLIGRKIEAGFVLFAALSMLAPATVPAAGKNMSGGGYAVSGQLQGVGYTAELFDADNGLPTSDANCVLATRDGYIWIGGYSGVIRYDGMSFERLDASEGLTSARCMFEDSRNRLWVGTNDNGAVLLDQEERTHFTVDDGLTSPSVRAIGEDADGKIYLGTAMGISYIDTDGSVHPIRDERLNEECIVRLVPGDAGQV